MAQVLPDRPKLQTKVSHEEAEIEHIEKHPIDLSNGMCVADGTVQTVFDPAAEKRLRWKIDLYVVPTVAILYLLCFIDRINIGKLLMQLHSLHTLI